MSFRIKILFISILSAFLTFASAQAKELTNRLGVGYANQFSSSIPSLAVRYYPDPKLGVGAQLGVDTNKNNSLFGAMARIYRVVFTEDNMNFYMGSSAGLISTQTNNITSSGFELSGFIGTEFFFTGLENLGFSFEAGVGVTSVSSQVRFRTIGDTPMNAGVVFYF
jgi:hypothetical protein